VTNTQELQPVLPNVGVGEDFRPFFNSIIEHPGDTALWLIAADWCLEQGFDLVSMALKDRANVFSTHPDWSPMGGIKETPAQVRSHIYNAFHRMCVKWYPHPYKKGMELEKGLTPKTRAVTYKVNRRSVRIKRNGNDWGNTKIGISCLAEGNDIATREMCKIPYVGLWFYLSGGWSPV